MAIIVNTLQEKRATYKTHTHTHKTTSKNLREEPFSFRPSTYGTIHPSMVHLHHHGLKQKKNRILQIPLATFFQHLQNVNELIKKRNTFCIVWSKTALSQTTQRSREGGGSVRFRGKLTLGKLSKCFENSVPGNVICILCPSFINASYIVGHSIWGRRVAVT